MPARSITTTLSALYAEADEVDDAFASDVLCDLAADFLYRSAARVPMDLDEALDAFDLAETFLGYGAEVDRLIDHAHRLTRQHGRTLEAIIVLRQAARMIEQHEDYRPLIDVVAGLVAWMARPNVMPMTSCVRRSIA